MSVDPPELPSLPDAIVERVQAALEIGDGTAEAALCAEHPEHSEAIRQWFALAEASEADAGPPVVAGSLPRDPRQLDLLRSVPVLGGFKVLGPAVLWRTVGAGGMGCVLRGRHLRLDHDVAVKCMQPGIAAGNPSLFARFQREAQLGARLSSENIIHVTDCGEFGDLRYLIMEWVDGEDLSGRIGRLGPRPQDEAVTLLVGIARGLRDVHGAGVLHRDIKPQNVMVSRGGLVKLADLGIASMVSEQLTVSGELLGTRSYMAPEQWDGSAPVGPQADIYALGLTAHFTLTGSVAKAAPMQDVPPMAQQVPEIDPRLGAWIDRCCQRNPADRFADGAAALDGLLAITAGDPKAGAPALGHRDGRLQPDEVDLPPATGDAVAPPMDLTAIRAAAEAGAEADARTLPSPAPPRGADPAPSPAGAQRRWWPVAAVAGIVLAATSGWWFFGPDSRSGADDQPPTTSASGERVTPAADRTGPGGGAGAPPPETGVDPSAGGPRDGASVATPGGTPEENDDKNPQPPQPIPALLEVRGDFATAPDLADGESPWVFGEPLAYLAKGDVSFRVEVTDAEGVRGELQADTGTAGTAEAANVKRIDPGQFELLWNGISAGRRTLRLTLEGPGGNKEVVREIVVPCTLPEVPGMRRFTASDSSELDIEHYGLGADGLDEDLADLRFVRIEGIGAERTRDPDEQPGREGSLLPRGARESALFGITEVSARHVRAWIRAGLPAFQEHVVQDDNYSSVLKKVGQTIEARFAKLEEDLTIRESENRLEAPMTYLHVHEAVGFARWLSQIAEVDVEVTGPGIWRRAALRNLDLEVDDSRTEAFDPRDLKDGYVNFNPARGDLDDLINRDPGGGKPSWNIWSGKQGSIPLFNVAGNAEEMCPVMVDGALTGWVAAGGSYVDSKIALLIPSDDEPPRSDFAAACNSWVGFRLVISPKD